MLGSVGENSFSYHEMSPLASPESIAGRKHSRSHDGSSKPSSPGSPRWSRTKLSRSDSKEDFGEIKCASFKVPAFVNYTTAKELEVKLSSNKSQLLLLDVRTRAVQQERRIINSIGLPCESKINVRRITAVIDNFINIPINTAWKMGFCEAVICTQKTPLDIKNPVNILIYNLTSKLKLKVSVLKGSVTEFLKSYPNFIYQSKIVKQNDFDFVEDQYCTLNTLPIQTRIGSPVSQQQKLEHETLPSPGADSNAKFLRTEMLVKRRLSTIAPCMLNIRNISFENVEERSSQLAEQFLDSSEIHLQHAAEHNPTRIGHAHTEWLNISPMIDYKKSFRTIEDILSIKASKIFPFLYLGNEADASSEGNVESLGIQAVINVTKNVPFLNETRYDCLRIPVTDSYGQDLRAYFKQAIEFIERHRRQQRTVLVHCSAGISRSPAIVLAYIMANSTLSMNSAYQFLRSKRKVVAPNFTFLGQLHDFEMDLQKGVEERHEHQLKKYICEVTLKELLARSTDTLIL